MRSGIKYAIALLLALSSCAVVAFLLMGGLPTAGAPAASKRWRIEIVLKARANPPDFWRIVEQGVNMAAQEFAVDCYVSGPENENDIEGQQRLAREAIAKKPDALILAAADYERLVPCVEEAVDAGIPVIMMDSDVNSDRKISLVATDNYALGKKLASLVDSLTLPDEAFGVVGHVEGTATAMGRSRGLLENVSNCDERLSDIAWCGGSATVARQMAEEMLLKNPDIRCMVGLNESSALGIAEAIASLELAGEVKLVACDSSQAMIQYMESGTIQAFVVQNPFNIGYLSVQAAVNALDGKKPEPVIFTESIVITKDDMYRQENQKLLFPFTDQ